MSEAYIYDALRTPRGKGNPSREGKPGGSLSHLAPQELVSQLVDALRSRQGDAAIDDVDRLTLGCVGQVNSQGGHIALVSKVASSLPEKAVPKTINNYCVSGLTAVIESVRTARAGESGLSLAGGVEMLSQVPFLADKASYYSDPKTSQALDWVGPIMGAELMGTIEGHTKLEYDALAVRSHKRAAKAWAEGHFDQAVVPVKNEDGSIALDRDEWVRPDMTMEFLSETPPAFAKMGEAGQDAIMLKHYPELSEVNHIHSIAHAPGMADGAALVLIGTKEAGDAAGLSPKARVIAVAETAGDPVLQFGAGFDALDQALEKAELSLDQIDLIEFMEAFAAPPLRFEKVYAPDMSKVNVNGGHIAMGHPMGATGGILVANLLHELERQDKRYGLVVGLAGGGLGAAMVIERI